MLPQSEKQFVGNLPFSSVISFNHLHQSGIVFGIHWMDVDNQMTDLDLKVFSNTRSVSWNSSYKYGSDILYSGDLTMAPKPNGASEFIYISKNVIDENFTVKVNKYNSPKADIPFEFIIAYSDGNNIEDYIVDPKDIIIKIPCIIPKGQSEYVLGIYAPNIKMNKFIITDLSTNDLPVSKNNALDTILRQYLLNYEEATKDFTLNSLLEDSKAKISSTPEIEVAKEHWLIIGEDGGTKVEEASNLTELEPSRIIEKGLYKKVKVPVDIDLSIESLTKVTLLDLFTVN